MAGTITHAYFAIDVFNGLNKEKKVIIEPYLNNLKTFAQGHDIYNFTKPNNSHYFHTHDTNMFFINMINYIKDNHLYEDGEILSFLYGYICHYVLDKNIHPYVIYKSGRYFKKNKKETAKYRCKHAEVETYLDCYMIKNRNNIEPGKFNTKRFCLSPSKFSSRLKDLMDYTFDKTYNYKNASKNYYKAVKNMGFLYNLLRKDRFKIKKRIYNTVDRILPDYFYKYSPISYALTKEYKQYLNNERKTWNHPADVNEKYNSSFNDIYEDSVKETIKIINAVDNYFNNKKVDLNKIFDNTSFITGKNCNVHTKMIYFEY